MIDRSPAAARLLPSPLGPLLAEACGHGVTRLAFLDPGPCATEPDTTPARADRPRLPADEHLDQLARQLDDYFEGRSLRFSVPLAPHGTPFQHDVWNALRLIQPGGTISYSELARRVGRPRAVRAVGRANGTNPIPILVPCHRVIAADGSLHGYAGGLERKQHLLTHERRITDPALLPC